MFLLSNQVMQELVTAEHTPSEEEVTSALWNRFCEEADISVAGHGDSSTDFTEITMIYGGLFE